MKHWVEAARLRTLPLSVSGIIVGSFYAMSQGMFNWNIVIFALLTTLGLQILSNFANDYGDGVKGTDNDDRVGPKRAIQSGVI
ncbi:MAG TPA: 1,4-dihydroxy-2-naphthoate polyprenyltransferase, partial [Flavobacterium sp.]|nr:1,4-dihydroxy-2-naphthoate polyprenyltransferase [Flavobacterium sp.]